MPAKNTNQTLDSHTAGGYKATLSNPNSSEEAKKHAQEMLDNAGIDANEKLGNNGRSNNDASDTQVAGGYKATLSNPNSSEEAKKHAREMLEKAGINPDEKADSSNRSNNDASDTHVAGGYKATLSNPNASEEAKKHAREMLEKAGVDPEERLSSSGRRDDLTEEEKHRHHVEGGYKATLNNANASEEAKQHASEMLAKLAKGEELPESERTKNNNSYKASGDAHDNHVLGGYKATLSNPNSSEEAKKHAQEMLDKAGVDAEKGDKSSEKHGLKRSSDDVEAEDKESGKGKQGFASMPKEKVQEIASKGGRTANAGEEPSPKKSKTDESSPKKTNESSSDNGETENKESGKGKQGFASMPKEKVQEIASKGGRTSHAGEEPSPKKSNDEKSTSDNNDKETSGKGKQGFASMPKEKVQEIASKGGRTKNAGEEPAAVKNQ